ncbi:MAG: exodeoxyribonuclease [Chloroflexi bacterium]|nr:exodeoxyribonuclease [Chloroflexota bacterium]
MKLATWNVNSIRQRLDIVTDWLRRERPDLLCLQETKVVDELFPLMQLAEVGYTAAYVGERTYNGVAIISREPLEDVRVQFPLATSDSRRLISGIYHGVRVYSAYFPNGRDPQNEQFAFKLAWIDALGNLTLPGPNPEGPIALLGDFNVAPEPRDVYDPIAMDGRILYHPAEREALVRLKDRGFVDAFRLARNEDKLFSWWDYRQGAFRRNLGFRIDHVWVTTDLAPKVTGARIDVEERRKEHASDHAPVVVEMDD